MSDRRNSGLIDRQLTDSSVFLSSAPVRRFFRRTVSPMSQIGAQELPAILSVKDVVDVLPVTADTVRSWIRRRELVASGLGTDRLGRPCPPYAILRESLVEFLEQRQPQVNELQDAPPKRQPKKRKRRPRKPLVSAEVDG